MCIFSAGLTRGDLVGLGLLLGCDYCPQGVPGVGKEGAMKLIRHYHSQGIPEVGKHGAKNPLRHFNGAPGPGQRAHEAQKTFDLLDLFKVWMEGGLLDPRSSFEERLQR